MTELEDAATDTERIKSVPQPLVQESAHPYTDDAVQTGHVRIAGAEGLRVEFDRQVGITRTKLTRKVYLQIFRQDQEHREQSDV